MYGYTMVVFSFSLTLHKSWSDARLSFMFLFYFLHGCTMTVSLLTYFIVCVHASYLFFYIVMCMRFAL